METLTNLVNLICQSLTNQYTQISAFSMLRMIKKLKSKVGVETTKSKGTRNKILG